MDKIGIDKNIINIFNTPFELGMRMVYLLSSMYPSGADLQKLVLLDYAVVYSGDFDGPDSLHTPVPFRGNELYSRRELINTGLHLMSTRKLVIAELNEFGIVYFAGDESRSFIDSIDISYAEKLINRCLWATNKFGHMNSIELTSFFNENNLRWGAEIESKRTVSI